MSVPVRRWFFALAVVVHLALLYWPLGVSNPDGLPLDKLMHAGIFGMVLLAGVRADVPARLLVVLLVLNAAASELFQHFLLPGRSGDPYDFIADVTGVVIVTALLRARGRAVADPG